jgi:hypothetical protein
VAPRSKQPRRCQVAEEMRGPPIGRAHRGGGGVNPPLGVCILRWHFGGLRVREFCSRAGTRSLNVLGPVPGVGVMAKRSQGWVKCEDRLSYCKDSPCSLPLATTPRPRLHDSRGPRRGRGRPGSRARSSGALAASMQHEGAVPGSCVQNEMRRASHLWTK